MAVIELHSDTRGAVSYRIVIFLIALLVTALVYSILTEAIGNFEGLVVSGMDTAEGTQWYEWQSLIWNLAPVFILIACGAWLLKQGVIVQR